MPKHYTPIAQKRVISNRSLRTNEPMQPIKLREWDSQVQHADMLRYDLAFHNPDVISEVIFPIFNTPNGRTSRNITVGRWDSYGMHVGAASFVESVGNWITFRHTENYQELKPETLDQFMQRNPKYKIVGWR